MKIAVPTDDGKTIAGHFGRAGYFTIFEIEEGSVKEKKMIENNPYHGNVNHEDHDHHHEHPGAEHGHVRFISLLEGCQVIISRGMGRRAVADLSEAGIEPVFTRINEIDDAVKAYTSGTMERLDRPECGKH